jgi:hypothetical protein
MQDRKARYSEVLAWLGEQIGNHAVRKVWDDGLTDATVQTESGRAVDFSFDLSCGHIETDADMMLSEIYPDLFWDDEIEEKTAPALEKDTAEQGETNDVFAQLQDDTFGDYTEDRRFYAAELSGWWG